ncbi:MAG: rod shape-determining protein MreC [Acidobacteria bacterium]|nr:rod shape-determining protein MreC [Acidobacteriota bacterium]MBI3262995.1 rod shape-determining protein MreC [Acidobacteriota bacterium]
MFILQIRHRTGSLFLMAVVGHLILISAQVTTRTGVPILSAVTFGALSELQRVAAVGVGALRGVWAGYLDLRGVRTENEALKRELSDLQVRYQSERATAQRSEALRALLQLRDRTRLPTIAAEVIAGSATPELRAVTIDKGTADGLRTDMAVISGAGVVGRVVTPGAHAAAVQLLVDRSAAVGGLVERSRTQGVLVGTGGGELRFEYVSETADLKEGDHVVTSGIDGIYPKGFLIGAVVHIEKAGTSYKEIRIRPSVDFAAIEEVLVVLAPDVTRPGGGGE